MESTTLSKETLRLVPAILYPIAPLQEWALVPLPPSSDLPSSFPLCFSAKNPHFEEAPAVLHANRRSTPIIDVGKQGARDTSPDKNQTRDTNITYVFQACSWASLLLFQATIARSCAVPCRLSRPNKWPSRCIRPAGGKRRNPSNPRLPLFTQLWKLPPQNPKPNLSGETRKGREKKKRQN